MFSKLLSLVLLVRMSSNSEKTVVAVQNASDGVVDESEIWYMVFIWCLGSSIFVYTLGAVLAFFTLRKHRFGRY